MKDRKDRARGAMDSMLDLDPETLKRLVDQLSSISSHISVADFVAEYMKRNEVVIEPHRIYEKGKIVRNVGVLIHRMHQDWKLFKSERRLKCNISKEEIRDELDCIAEEMWEESRRQLCDTLAWKPDAKRFDKILERVVTAIAGKTCSKGTLTHRQNKAFLAHFIWQTMTKLHEGPEAVLRSGNEAMLLLVSRQQKTGKSTFARLLLAPFLESGFVWRPDFMRLEDNLSLRNLVYNYVAWFDDAARATVKNMARFKQIVTDEEICFRQIYTATEIRQPKLATFIGTSNVAARDLINDTTGLRRFHQIHVNGESVDTGRGIDLDDLRKVDFLELYRSCPREDITPLFRYISDTELREYEESIRPLHVVERWLADMGYSPGTPEDELMPFRDLYRSMRLWAMENGYGGKYTPNSASFGHLVSEIGFEKGRTNAYRGVYVKKENVCQKDQ